MIAKLEPKWRRFVEGGIKSHRSALTSHFSRGITLIALVVTIVILVVIAAVSFGAIFGEHSILDMVRLRFFRNSKGEGGRGDSFSMDRLYDGIYCG